MKKVSISIILLIALFSTVFGQSEPINSKMGFGGQFVQYQNDFGVGLNMTSPYFANKKMAVRLKGNYMWLEHLNTSGETTWTPYSNVSLGFTSIAAELNGFTRLYGEGGAILVLPSSEFSSESYNIGGYGLFGFEFIFVDKYSYYLEVGGMGTGANADRVAGSPIFSN